MKYPWIEKLGLRFFKSRLVVDDSVWHVVAANDLENLLESAQTVYGQMHSEINGSFTTEKMPEKESWALKHTHTAKLLCIEPIKKGVTRKELIDFLNTSCGTLGYQQIAQNLIQKIESEGIID